MIFRPDSSLLKEEISRLDTKIIGRDLYYFETIDSTNLFAKKLVKNGVGEGVVVIADVQSSGRGRKNRKWSSPEGGLWFSIILYPPISPDRGMLVTMASSIAVAQGIKEVTGINSEIKWPNDLLINGKKVCGILTEIYAEKDNIKYAITGIGINVNNRLEKELHNTATTLKQEIGNQVLKVELLKSILKNLDEQYNKIIFKNYKFIKDSWLSFSNIIGKKIQVQDDNILMIGKVINIDDNGCLILDTKNGTARIVNGDIKYL
jgi:BirA family biotin operon repressor/biotin-[acetyl-CoA-carboxylase] ligase